MQLDMLTKQISQVELGAFGVNTRYIDIFNYLSTLAK
jgi:hypothetical protein